MSPSQNRNQPAHLAGPYRLGGYPFRPRVFGFVDIWKDFRSGDEYLFSRDSTGPRRCPDAVAPRGLTRRALGPCGPANLESTRVGLEFKHLAGRHRPGGCPFVPGLFNLQMHGLPIGWRFNTMWCGVDSGHRRVCPYLVGVVEISRDV